MIQIVNVAKATRYHYIGRSKKFGASSLGNPFIIGRDGDRPAVVAKYRQWLWSVIQSQQQPAYGELQRLATIASSGDLILGCHCAPLACHGDVIKSAIEWILSQALG